MFVGLNKEISGNEGFALCPSLIFREGISVSEVRVGVGGLGGKPVTLTCSVSAPYSVQTKININLKKKNEMGGGLKCGGFKFL